MSFFNSEEIASKPPEQGHTLHNLLCMTQTSVVIKMVFPSGQNVKNGVSCTRHRHWPVLHCKNCKLWWMLEEIWRLLLMVKWYTCTLTIKTFYFYLTWEIINFECTCNVGWVKKVHYIYKHLLLWPYNHSSWWFLLVDCRLTKQCKVTLLLMANLHTLRLEERTDLIILRILCSSIPTFLCIFSSRFMIDNGTNNF